MKILQCPLDGAVDEMNLIQVFKEAYEILYTYMIGKSRKNALYFAKYIEFFQTQFTQKVQYYAHIYCKAILLKKKKTICMTMINDGHYVKYRVESD